MNEVDKIRSLLETSGLLQYPVDSDMLIDFIFSRAQTLTDELTREVTPGNWTTRRKQLLEKLRYCVGVGNFPKSQGVNGRSTGKIAIWMRTRSKRTCSNPSLTFIGSSGASFSSRYPISSSTIMIMERSSMRTLGPTSGYLGNGMDSTFRPTSVVLLDRLPD